jgi:hypothetical protein
MKVFRNASGVVRNIGEWDYMPSRDVDENGDIVMIINNPLPTHYVESDEEVTEGWDGGLYVVGDPQAEKPS